MSKYFIYIYIIMELYNDNCFNIFPQIQDNYVDLFVLDLPYANKKFGNCTACRWDTPIDLKEMWKEIKRIMKPNATIVFFCNTKFGWALIDSNPKWFKYDLIWKKSRKVGFLSANKMPLRQHENIYIFKDKQGTYNPQKTEGKPYKGFITKNNKEIGEVYGGVSLHNENKGDRHPSSIIEMEAEHENIYIFKDKQGTYNPQKVKGKTYNKYRPTQNIITTDGAYGKIFKANKEQIVNDRHPTSIIEMEKDLGMIKGGYYRGEGQKPFKRMPNDPTTSHPTSIIEMDNTLLEMQNTIEQMENTILEYKNATKTIHPTQKPVDLLEWLIKSYSNEDDVVMDFCMGSGTAGVAAKNLNRKFIGVEMDKEIYDKAYKRINE